MSEHGTTITYSGVISEQCSGENTDALFLGDIPYPLAKEIADDIYIHGKFLSVRYFISDEPKTLDQLETDLLNHLEGEGEATYRDCYSDLTGYLWTDEDLNVGGHDLMKELRSHVGRFVLLEITYHEEAGVVILHDIIYENGRHVVGNYLGAQLNYADTLASGHDRRAIVVISFGDRHYADRESLIATGTIPGYQRSLTLAHAVLGEFIMKSAGQPAVLLDPRDVAAVRAMMRTAERFFADMSWREENE